MKIERDSFKELVSTKANLVLPSFGTPPTDVFIETTNSTAEGSDLSSNDSNSKSTIIVDEREFRSSLPFQLIRRGNCTIVPRTLFCGDYILSPHVIVERKSATDLESSLNDGRMLSQLYTMTRDYSVCCLLIESGSTYASDYESVDGDRGVLHKLTGMRHAASKVLSDIRIIEKLCAVTKSFPHLRLLWSETDLESVMLFKEIKKSRSEPYIPADLGVVFNRDPIKHKHSMITGLQGYTSQSQHEESPLRSPSESDENFHLNSPDESFVPYASQILLHLPGVNLNNMHKLVNKYDSLCTMAKASITCLRETLGYHNATLLYNALNTPSL
eukprot:CAMPEP_0201535962 /NCGR_PEP_ID=MMETSP0161_2-20130828/60540_1 /ASSEMBLY_ACC=CAM_ASM_000251 /TAXON_ID=180227 /ORGANISM="Neoparamoeba aestuarina, Strain SoJaBio B1-5/56/2" /LENGTH=328 /DNA_ID=CAMNT_0047941395 /DNA_START=67 /DNA_END=1053 /DNA_ORIENTATION=-